MNADDLKRRFTAVCKQALPLPGRGETAQRHLRLFDIAREDVSLAKLAEAHYDAEAILAEAGHVPRPGMLYAVWASEIPESSLEFARSSISGKKAFCTGGGIVDRALVTVGGDDRRLLDLGVRSSSAVTFDLSQWQTDAFRGTNTGSVEFSQLRVDDNAVIGETDFYLQRPGFWHGAVGPAACWAGGAAGLLDDAEKSSRSDPHTLAHLAAMHANVWTMRSVLDTAGREIDAEPDNIPAAQERALKARHIIEQLATDILRRFARAYGPSPLAMREETARRYAEVDLFLRQSHGERDLHALAGCIQLQKSTETKYLQ